MAKKGQGENLTLGRRESAHRPVEGAAIVQGLHDV
jgi:hypothetical protein